MTPTMCFYLINSFCSYKSTITNPNIKQLNYFILLILDFNLLKANKTLVETSIKLFDRTNYL